MMPEKFAFIEAELFTMTLMATGQRGNLYQANCNDSIRQRFRDDLHAKLIAISVQYEVSVTEQQHVRIIEKLANELSKDHANALLNGRFRIGSAQKALNLYLKYLWCLDRISMPPHCPIDSVIASKLPERKNFKWTKLDSIIEYEGVISEAKRVAHPLPLAEWELHVYQKRTQPAGRTDAG